MVPSLGPLLVPLATLLAAAPAPPAAQDATPAAFVVHLVEVPVDADDPGRLAAVAALGLEIAARVGETGDALVVAGDEDLARLAELGVPFEVRTRDLQAFYAARLAADAAEGLPEGGLGAWLVPPPGQGGMGGYYTFAEVVSVMQQIAAAYPGIVAMSSLGQSIQGRDIWALTISDDPGVDEGEPAARVDSVHHAREPMSMQVALWFVLELVESYGVDPFVTWLVDEREIWVVPIVNPDGYVWNQTIAPNGGGMWRKNRRVNPDDSIGVDLNRNYTFNWGFDNIGSSPIPSSSSYRGTAPASEPETQAMEALMADRGFGTSLTMHTFGELWLTPLSHQQVLAANDAQYKEIGGLATEENGYPVGTSWQLLNIVNGTAKDHDHGVNGAISCTPEFSSSGDGFWPPGSQILPQSQENLSSLVRTVHAAGAWIRVLSRQTVDEGDGDGFPEAGESVGFELVLRNSGVAGPATTVVARLQSPSPDVTVDVAQHDFGAIAPFSEASNAGQPLRLSILPGTPLSTPIPYTLEVEVEGLVTSFPGTLDVGERVPFVRDDVELDLGWVAGAPGDTAISGVWQRADPIGNSYAGVQQSPADDATPPPGALCFVTGNGSSASGTDVDSGFTTLITPSFDLSEGGTAYMRYARWFACTGDEGQDEDDELVVEISNDGGQSWTALEVLQTTQNAWTTVQHRVADFVPQTADMRLRFVVADDPNDSVTDAAIDDFDVEVVYELPRFTIYGLPEVGTDVLLNVTGESGDGYLTSFAFGTFDLPIPGVQGENLLIDPASSFLLYTGSVPSSRLATDVLDIPDDATLVGATVHFQAVVFGPAGIFLTNRDEITLQ